jgi:glycosyltransferase involved in cell wall biosynthesis
VSEQQSLRVLHIGKYLPPVPGGIETYLGDLLRVSMRHGLEVGAVVHGKKGYPDPDPADFGGAATYTVPTYGQVLYAPVAPMFSRALRKAIREFKPDVLHMHVPNTSAFWALSVPEARRIPWVLHWHADVDVGLMSAAMRVAYAFYRFFERAMLTRASAIITTSLPYAEASRALGPFRKKSFVIRLGLDCARLPNVTQAEIADAKSYWPLSTKRKVLAVGRLTYYKAFDTLIHAVLRAPDCSVLIGGDGELRGRLEQLVRKLRLQDRVRFLGRISDRRLAAYYSACDVFCLPSIDRSEAFGLVLLEASHYGATIVATDIRGSGVPSVARTLGGVLTPVNDIDALAAALSEGGGRAKTAEYNMGSDIELYPFMRLYKSIKDSAAIQ